MRPKAIEDKSYWLKHVENYKASGLNKNRYCVQHSVSYHKFLYWFDKLTSQSSSSRTVRKAADQANQFIKIKLNSEAKQISGSAKPLCILELKQGHRLLVHNEAILEKLFLLLSE